jgi:hypothetical protein
MILFFSFMAVSALFTSDHYVLGVIVMTLYGLYFLGNRLINVFGPGPLYYDECDEEDDI